MKSEEFDFLTDEEAVAFIALMTGTLREIAGERSFRPLMKGLTSAEQAAKAMKRLNRKVCA